MKEETERQIIRLLIIIVLILFSMAGLYTIKMMIDYRGRWCQYTNPVNNITITGIDCNLADELYTEQQSIYDHGLETIDYTVNTSFDMDKPL